MYVYVNLQYEKDVSICSYVLFLFQRRAAVLVYVLCGLALALALAMDPNRIVECAACVPVYMYGYMYEYTCNSCSAPPMCTNNRFLDSEGECESARVHRGARNATQRNATQRNVRVSTVPDECFAVAVAVAVGAR